MNNYIYHQVRKYLSTHIKDVLHELKKDRFYILLLPEGVDQDYINEQIADFDGQVNLLVLIADDAKLLELS